jgi:hypothetical protein
MDFVHGLKTIDALRKQAKAASERLNPYQPTNQTTKRAQSPFKRKFQKNLGGAPADSARGGGGGKGALARRGSPAFLRAWMPDCFASA